MFVKICLQLFCLLKNLFFENEKTPKELFVWAGWLAKLIQRKHAQQCCISTSFSPSTRTSSSLFVLNLIILWWLTAFLQHIRLHSRHSVLCGSKSLTYWQDRRQNEPPRGLTRMVDRAYCPWSVFALGLCFLASTSGTLCIVLALSSIEVKLHYSVIV